MKKYILPILLTLFFSGVLAQTEVTRLTTYFGLASDSISVDCTKVTTSPDTLSLEMKVAENTNDTFFVAFPWQVKDTKSFGFPTVLLTTKDTIYVQAWGYPAKKVSWSNYSWIKLRQVLLHQSDFTKDSLSLMADTLKDIGVHRLQWGVRAGGDDLPWGPSDGMMICFKWISAVETDSDTSLTWEVEGQ